MTTFRFLHTADWQIGKAFGRLPPDTAAILRQARLDVIDRIAELAREREVSNVLVAGDVLDSETLPPEVIARMLAKLAAHREVTWHLISGNHDPARPGGVWDGVSSQRPASNVRLHLRPEAAEIARDVFLLPAPLLAKATSTDPTAWMDQAGTPAGALRIGMAHGSIRGFDSQGEAAVMVDPARPDRAGLAYLAMGDWHGAQEIGRRLRYSGTPEPDGYADNASGNVLLVTARGSDTPAVEMLRTANFTWTQRRVEGGSIADLERLAGEVGDLGARAGTYLMRLVLSGRVTGSEMEAIEEKLRGITASLMDLRVERSELQVATAADEVEALDDPALVAVAARIRAKTEVGEPGEQRVAALALRKLIGFSRQRPAGAAP